MTTYEPDPKSEVFGDVGDQTEEFSDENKSIVWFLVKQVKNLNLTKYAKCVAVTTFFFTCYRFDLAWTCQRLCFPLSF